jgi:hypothetical protein
MPHFIAIGANTGLPATWYDIFEQAKVLCDHAGQQPVPFLGHPLRAAGHEQGSSVFVSCPDLDRYQRSCTGHDWCALDQQLDGGVAQRTIVTEAVADADKLIAVALGETLCAVLIRCVGLGDAKRRES